jgi:hypothetical protein
MSRESTTDSLLEKGWSRAFISAQFLVTRFFPVTVRLIQLGLLYNRLAPVVHYISGLNSEARLTIKRRYY